MSKVLFLFVAVVFILVAGTFATSKPSTNTPTSNEGVPFNITDGVIKPAKGRLVVESPGMRATLARGKDRAVTVRFTYFGPTNQKSALANGEVRSQFGLKLRAQNPCNLVYAVWRFSEGKMVVQVKKNDGQSTHKQCRDNGYTTIGSVPLSITTGEEHTFGAVIDGDLLMVSADGKEVWQGHVGQAALTFDGPVGVRSDNARLIFDLTSRSK
jgi:hypothetical protein